MIVCWYELVPETHAAQGANKRDVVCDHHVRPGQTTQTVTPLLLACWQTLEDDDQFLMGHVLVGASQCLNPAVHQDSLDAAEKVSVASAIVQTNGACTCVQPSCQRYANRR